MSQLQVTNNQHEYNPDFPHSLGSSLTETKIYLLSYSSWLVPTNSYKNVTSGTIHNIEEKLPPKLSLIISEILHLIILRYDSHTTNINIYQQ